MILCLHLPEFCDCQVSINRLLLDRPRQRDQLPEIRTRWLGGWSIKKPPAKLFGQRYSVQIWQTVVSLNDGHSTPAECHGGGPKIGLLYHHERKMSQSFTHSWISSVCLMMSVEILGSKCFVVHESPEWTPFESDKLLGRIGSKGFDNSSVDRIHIPRSIFVC
jgi:hypothetical protein